MNLHDRLEELDDVDVSVEDLWARVSMAHMQSSGDVGPAARVQPWRARAAVVVVALALSLFGTGLAVFVLGESTKEGPQNAMSPSEVNVTCGKTGASVTEQTVRAQPDGVHILVENRSNAVGVSILYAGGGGGVNIQPTDQTSLVVDVPPGETRIGCDNKTLDIPLVHIQVVDPEHIYVTKELSCEQTANLGGQSVIGTDPREVVSRALEPILRPDDVVTPAGYPEAESPTMRVMRGASTVAVVRLVQDYSGQWMNEDPIICADLLPNS